MSRQLKNDKISTELDIRAQKAYEEIHRYTKAIENLRKQNAEHRKEISRLAATEGDYSAEIKRLNEDIRKNTKEIDVNKRAIEKEREKVDLSRMSAADLGRELKNLKKQLANTSKATNREKYRDLERQIRQVEKAYAEATKSTRGFMTSLLSLDKIGTAVKGFFMGLGMTIVSSVVGSFKKLNDIIIDFERANSKLAAILGTNIAGISSLTEQAKFLGRTTSATASEVTGLQTELAKLGFVKADIENMTPAVLKFAKAVDTDLSSAAAFAGASLRIFGKDSSDTENTLATLAIATTKTALDFSKLEASMATVGPVANAAGFSIEETTALLGTLANNGFDASSAATALRNIFLKLADNGSDLSRALGEPVKNLDDLRTGLLKLEEQGVDLQKALEMTDKRSVAAFMSIMKGAGDLDGLCASISDVSDEFRQMSATMADNAAGTWKGFESAIEGLALKFFDFREVLKELFTISTELVQWIGKVIDHFKPLGSLFAGVGKIIAGLVVYLGKLVGWISSLIGRSEVLVKIINGVVAAIIAYRIAVAASSVANLNFIKTLGVKNTALKEEITLTGLAKKKMEALIRVWKNHAGAIIISAIAMIIVALKKFTVELSAAEKAEKAWQDAEKVSQQRYVDAKTKIDELRRSAKNENLTMEERLTCVKKLNAIIPNYNASIDATTGKYRESTKALADYNSELRKKLRYEANKEKLMELTKETERLRLEKENADKAAEEEIKRNLDKPQPRAFTSSGGAGAAGYSVGYQKALHAAQDYAKHISTEFDKAVQAENDFAARIEKGLNSGELVSGEVKENVETNLEKPLGKAAGAATGLVDRVKELRKEMKELRKADPQTDEEFKAIEARKDAIRKELKGLSGKGKGKNRRTPGTYAEDSIDEATAKADDDHMKKLLEINKLKGEVSDNDLLIKKNEEAIRYCGDLLIALKELRDKTDETHTQTLDKITEEENKIGIQILAAQQAISRATYQKEKEAHTRRLAAQQAYYDELENKVQKEVNDRVRMEEAADLYLMNEKRNVYQTQLKELQEFEKKTTEATYLGAEDREKILEKVAADIRAMQSRILTSTGQLAARLRGLITNTNTPEGIREEYALKRKAVEQEYAEALKMVKKGSEQEIALKTEMRRRLASLTYEEKEKEWQRKELTGLTWAQEYQRELDAVNKLRKEDTIKEIEYQKKLLQIKMENAKRYFDYYAQLSGSMFSAIQDAEIAQSEAKYDVLIQQAKNNGEDTAVLEEEKENKKLEIQKKYADVDFAIKVSQIVADTAVGVIKTFAQFGYTPWGIAAAAMMSATGVAQMMAAEAERSKIKNMQPSTTASFAAKTQAETPATASRVLKGYSDGGYTGAGGRYDVAGVVHRGEYVVPQPIMNNPRVVDAVGTIEAIRRTKILHMPQQASSMPGFADGGYTGTPSMPDFSELSATVKELRAAVKNIRAYVVYRDIEEAGKTMQRARAPFTKP